MEIKYTKPLNVFVDNHLNMGELMIHPNDGFDLGLMNDKYQFTIYTGSNSENINSDSGNPVAGSISLSNSCKYGTVILSKRHWNIIGKQHKVILCLKSGKIFIIGK